MGDFSLVSICQKYHMFKRVVRGSRSPKYRLYENHDTYFPTVTGNIETI